MDSRSKEAVAAQFYYYASDSPTGLRWAVSTYSGKNASKLECEVGDVAGCIAADGYAKVAWVRGRQGRLSYAHRVVWFLHHGEIPPGMQVDHINGNRSDNRIENLRLVSCTINQRNRAKAVVNTSGVVGVAKRCIKRDDMEWWYWAAQWVSLDGVQRSKWFSVLKHGEDGAKQLAVKWRIKVIDELNEAGAGYSERHGTEMEVV